jgi:putative sigma-54 modulation protein
MKIDFVARRVRLSERVTSLAETKLGKLEKVLPSDAQARVVIRREKLGVAVEITISARQRTLTATEVAQDQETAARAAIAHIEAQARRTKGRVREEKKHRPSLGRTPAWEAPADTAPVEPPVGPRREPVTVRAMFEEDALTSFSASTREVMLFRDPTDDAVRVLYRRRDGSLGLLIPV